ncbi:hypothetical protein D3C80_1879880 [compost metagenome]
MAKGVVLEARAREGGAGMDGRVEAGVHHEQVVVPRLAIDVPGFALDQVTEHVVGHAPAQAAQRTAIDLERLIEHQRHRVVKA